MTTRTFFYACAVCVGFVAGLLFPLWLAVAVPVALLSVAAMVP